MTTYVDTLPAVEVQSWPQVAALALILAAFVTIPAVLTFLGGKQAKAARSHAESADTTVTEVARQLQPNGGKTVRDSLDRIEKVLTRHMDSEAEARAAFEDRLEALENRPARRGWLTRR